MKKSFSMILLVAAALSFSSCNTFIGMGRDIQSLGSGMQNTAEGKKWDGQTKQDPAQSAPPAQQPVGPPPSY